MDLKKLSQESAIYLLFCYIAGFSAWNYYLSHFGFFEYDLLQTRFLSAGFLILILPTIILSLNKDSNRKFREYSFLKQILIFFIWVSFFSHYIFPYIHQYFGGAKPFVVSMIANSDISQSFSLMGVSLIENTNKSIETIKGCKLYENDEVVVIGFSQLEEVSPTTINVSPNRVLIVNKDNIEAQSVLQQHSLINEFSCKALRFLYGTDPLGGLQYRIKSLF